jgi:poly(hydroxyalkanoate) depolymerase family esterase
MFVHAEREGLAPSWTLKAQRLQGGSRPQVSSAGLMLRCSKSRPRVLVQRRDRRRRTNIVGLSDTITRLRALRSRVPSHLPEEADQRLTSIAGFGSNPGDLLARCYIPEGLGAGAPLVVVLHGCTQSASSYNRGAGWTSAADEHGFALLFPEQQRANNPNLCFNWFSPTDARRGRGEALSIVQMVQEVCVKHALDPRRIFVTGLSAGGAMTAAMLATYPEVFAGGAVIAGLPFGTASTIPEAFEQMRGQAALGSDHLTALVRSASNHTGRWPTLSVWHGSNDQTVNASNAAALIDQWRGLHGVSAAPSVTDTVEGQPRRVWRNRDGLEVIEEFIIANMGHGTPIHAAPANAGEAAGPYMLEVGISSTRSVLAFWGLDRRSERSSAFASPSRQHELDSESRLNHGRSRSEPPPARSVNSVQEVIEKALRSAGLMK